MTSPNIGRPKALYQNGPNTDLPKVWFSSPTPHHFMLSYIRHPQKTYLCVCRRAPELILPFLVVGLAFTAGLAAFMPVVP